MMGNCNFTIVKPARQRPKSPVSLFMCLPVLTLCLGDADNGKTCSVVGRKQRVDVFTGCMIDQTDNASLFRDYNLSFSEKGLMLERLAKLRSDLLQGWDGYAGLPMESESYENTRKAISTMTGKALSHWNLFPCPNGTFLLTTKNSMASINIGNKEFSYAAYRNAEYQAKGILPYTDEGFRAVVYQINTMLGYDV